MQKILGIILVTVLVTVLILGVGVMPIMGGFYSSQYKDSCRHACDALGFEESNVDVTLTLSPVCQCKSWRNLNLYVDPNGKPIWTERL